MKERFENIVVNLDFTGKVGNKNAFNPAHDVVICSGRISRNAIVICFWPYLLFTVFVGIPSI